MDKLDDVIEMITTKRDELTAAIEALERARGLGISLEAPAKRRYRKRAKKANGADGVPESVTTVDA